MATFIIDSFFSPKPTFLFFRKTKAEVIRWATILFQIRNDELSFEEGAEQLTLKAVIELYSFASQLPKNLAKAHRELRAAKGAGNEEKAQRIAGWLVDFCDGVGMSYEDAGLDAEDVPSGTKNSSSHTGKNGKAGKVPSTEQEAGVS